LVHGVKSRTNIGITQTNKLYSQIVGSFCRRTTPDVLGVAVVATMLLSLESELGIVLTGTETNEATDTTCHMNAGRSWDKQHNLKATYYRHSLKSLSHLDALKLFYILKEQA
jgi:hypothetical protein